MVLLRQVSKPAVQFPLKVEIPVLEAAVSAAAGCESLFKLLPLVIDEFEEDAVHFLGVNEGELTIPEGAGFARGVIGQGFGIGDEGVVLFLEFPDGVAGILHVEADQHDPLAVLLDPLGHGPVGRSGFHKLKADPAEPVAGDADLLRLVHIRIVRLRLAEDRLPHFSGGVEVFHSDADVIYFFRFHWSSI